MVVDAEEAAVLVVVDEAAEDGAAHLAAPNRLGEASGRAREVQQRAVQDPTAVEVEDRRRFRLEVFLPEGQLEVGSGRECTGHRAFPFHYRKLCNVIEILYRTYGSGYPGYYGRGVGGLGFPFYFWPLAFGTVGGAAYLYNDEVRGSSIYHSSSHIHLVRPSIEYQQTRRGPEHGRIPIQLDTNDISHRIRQRYSRRPYRCDPAELLFASDIHVCHSGVVRHKYDQA